MTVGSPPRGADRRPPGPRRTEDIERLRFRSRLALLLAVVALPLAACSDDDDADAATSSTTEVERTTTTAEPTTTTLDPEQQVLAAYRAGLAAFSAAANPPNPEHPELLARFSGDALASIQDRLRSMQAQGVGAINTVETHATVVSMAGDVAMVEDCFIDRTQLIHLATGEAGEADETVAFLASQLERVDGGWKVTERQGGDEPCEPG